MGLAMNEPLNLLPGPSPVQEGLGMRLKYYEYDYAGVGSACIEAIVLIMTGDLVAGDLINQILHVKL